MILGLLLPFGCCELWVCKHLLETLLSVLPGVFPEMGLLSHMVFLCLIFWDPPYSFQQLSCFTFPPAVHKDSSFFTCLQSFFCFCFCCLCFWYQIQKITAKVDVKDESLNFDEVQFIYFFLLSMPLMSYLENAAKLWRFIVFMWLYVCICLCNLVYKV